MVPVSLMTFSVIGVVNLNLWSLACLVRVRESKSQSPQSSGGLTLVDCAGSHRRPKSEARGFWVLGH